MAATKHLSKNFKTAGSTLNVTKPLSRFDSKPLDSTGLYESKTEAEQYSKGDSHAYVGQIVTAIDSTNNTTKAYQIKDTTGNLREFVYEDEVVLKTGSTMSGDLNFVEGKGIGGSAGSNDAWALFASSTAEDAGYVELALRDNGSEPFYIRNYDTSGTQKGQIELCEGRVKASHLAAKSATITGDNTNITIENAAGTDQIVLSSAGNINAKGTLDVGGATTLDSTLTVKGISYLQANLNIASDTNISVDSTSGVTADAPIKIYSSTESKALLIDNNEIQTINKNATDSTNILYLNNDYGDVQIGQHTKVINDGGLYTKSITIDQSSSNITVKNSTASPQTSVTIATSGNITATGEITANTFNANSDVRLKENFQPLTPEKSILDLPTYKFDFINGLKNQIGCKAQDLQEICPEIVNEGSDGYLSIQESKIVYLLLEEVKKLRQELDELKKR